MQKTDVLILGAGCAGSSLAHHLEQKGFNGSVTLCDSRSSFNSEQRWCTWGRVPASMAHLVSHRWDEWTIITPSGDVINRSGDFSYSEIYAPEFFKSLHGPWLNGSSETRLHAGEEVIETKTVREGTVVVTKNHEWLAKTVFDSRFDPNLHEELKKDAKIFLNQSFLGWKIAFDRPVFFPGRAILMDFRVPESTALHFIYVLPYSETEALVESTSFDREPLPLDIHTIHLRKYIAEHFGESYRTLSNESGNLPMSSKRLRPNDSENFVTIGAAAGAIRPSSGYAFHRIQRTTKQIASRLASGRSITEVRQAASKYRLYDNVFLEVIDSDLPGATVHFERLFRSAHPDSLTRFMLDEGSIIDDVRVALSVKKLPFIKGIISVGSRIIAEPIVNSYEKVRAALRGSVDRSNNRGSVGTKDGK
ncbi:MAG: lycopene cyclase family protein [Acidobacteriota bacterium]